MFRQPIRGRRRQRRYRLRVTNRDTSRNLSEDTNLSRQRDILNISPFLRLPDSKYDLWCFLTRKLPVSHISTVSNAELPPCCSSASPAGGALIFRGWPALNWETERVCHGSYQRWTVTAESTIDQGKRDSVPRRDSQTKSPPLNQIGCSWNFVTLSCSW